MRLGRVLSGGLRCWGGRGVRDVWGGGGLVGGWGYEMSMVLKRRSCACVLCVVFVILALRCMM